MAISDGQKIGATIGLFMAVALLYAWLSDGIGLFLVGVLIAVLAVLLAAIGFFFILKRRHSR